MREYDFYVVVTGIDMDDDDALDRVIAATGSDCLITSHDGQVEVHFSRPARDYERAVEVAVKELRQAGITVVDVVRERTLPRDGD